MEKVELFNDPIAIKNSFSGDSAGTEMRDWELGFLCGLIKTYLPQKIVEIGVAAGGTSTVILNCLRKLALQPEFHSIDISEKFYRDSKLETGYLLKGYLENNDIDFVIDHKFHLGCCSVDVLDNIVGRNIDFLILDTMHILPGEILDFLACLPYLKNGAVVVVHDIALSHISRDSFDAFATKILMDVVNADKLYQVNPEFEMPTIGAFQITEETRKDIINVFAALAINWSYMPDQESIDKYRKHYERFYDKSCMEYFDIAERINKETYKRHQNYLMNDKRKLLLAWVDFLKRIEGSEIYIYGKGTVAEALTDMLTNMGKSVQKYIVSDEEMDKYSTADDVIPLSAVEADATIVIGVSEKWKDILCGKLSEKGCNKLITLERVITEFLLKFGTFN